MPRSRFLRQWQFVLRDTHNLYSLMLDVPSLDGRNSTKWLCSHRILWCWCFYQQETITSTVDRTWQGFSWSWALVQGCECWDCSWFNITVETGSSRLEALNKYRKISPCTERWHLSRRSKCVWSRTLGSALDDGTEKLVGLSGNFHSHCRSLGFGLWFFSLKIFLTPDAGS